MHLQSPVEKTLREYSAVLWKINCPLRLKLVPTLKPEIGVSPMNNKKAAWSSGALEERATLAATHIWGMRERGESFRTFPSETASKNNKENYLRPLFIWSLTHFDLYVINAPGADVFIKCPLAALATISVVGLARVWGRTNQRLQAAILLTLLWPGSCFPPKAALSTVMEADKQVDIAATVQYCLELRWTWSSRDGGVGRKGTPGPSLTDRISWPADPGVT